MLLDLPDQAYFGHHRLPHRLMSCGKAFHFIQPRGMPGAVFQMVFSFLHYLTWSFSRTPETYIVRLLLLLSINSTRHLFLPRTLLISLRLLGGMAHAVGLLSLQSAPTAELFTLHGPTQSCLPFLMVYVLGSIPKTPRLYNCQVEGLGFELSLAQETILNH